MPVAQFSNAKSVSKSGVPRGIELQPWMSTSDACSKRCAAWRADCSSWSQEETRSSRGTRTRAGSVLTSSPTIDSAPGRSIERPEATLPKTTSGLSV